MVRANNDRAEGLDKPGVKNNHNGERLNNDYPVGLDRREQGRTTR